MSSKKDWINGRPIAFDEGKPRECKICCRIVKFLNKHEETDMHLKKVYEAQLGKKLTKMEFLRMKSARRSAWEAEVEKECKATVLAF